MSYTLTPHLWTENSNLHGIWHNVDISHTDKYLKPCFNAVALVLKGVPNTRTVTRGSWPEVLHVKWGRLSWWCWRQRLISIVLSKFCGFFSHDFNMSFEFWGSPFHPQVQLPSLNRLNFLRENQHYEEKRSNLGLKIGHRSRRKKTEE